MRVGEYARVSVHVDSLCSLAGQGVLRLDIMAKEDLRAISQLFKLRFTAMVTCSFPGTFISIFN